MRRHTRTMRGSVWERGRSLANTLFIFTLCTLMGPHHATADEVPYFVQQPQSSLVTHHRPVTLHCEVKPPTAMIRWLFNGKPLEIDQHMGPHRDRDSLRFGHSSKEIVQEGEYRCLASTRAGTIISTPALLSKPVLSRFAQAVNITIKVAEGGYATLPCTAPESRPPAHMEIVTSLGRNLSSAVSEQRQVQRLPSGSAILRHLQLGDSGLYRCTAFNQLLGINRTAPQYIRLEVLPRLGDQDNQRQAVIVDQSSPSLQVTSNQDIILECPSSGFNEPNITWTKYGGDLPDGRSHTEFGNLHIAKVAVADGGTYICKTETELSRRISLKVHSPPTATAANDDEEITVSLDGKFTLTCIIGGFPAPSVTWFHNGVAIGRPKVQNRVNEHTLLLDKITDRDSGVYTCEASNLLGHASVHIHIVVENARDGQMSAGSDLLTVEGSSSNDTAEAIPIDDEYDVTTDGESKLENGSRDGKHTSLSKKKNPPKTTKKNKNRRRNKNRGRTKKVKMVPPSRPKVSRLSDTSVMLIWSVPENDGLPITFFRVQYKEVKPKKGRWQTLEKDIDTTTRRYEVSKLKAGGTYKFRIAAVYSNNDNKVGPNSKRFYLEVLPHPEPRPPKVKPKIVEAKPLIYQNIYAIGLKWQYVPVDGSLIEGFNIFYKPYDTQAEYEKQTLLGAGIRNHLLTDLQPDTDYTIYMQCFNSAGHSENSNIVVQKTMPREGQTPAVPPTQATPKDTRDKEGSDTFSHQESGGGLDQPVVLGIVLGIMLLILLIFIAMCWWKQRQQKRRQSSNKFQDQAQRIYTESLHKKYPNGGSYPLNGLNGLALANGHGIHAHHKTNIDSYPLKDMEIHSGKKLLRHDGQNGKVYHQQANSIPNGTLAGYGHSQRSDNNFNNIRHTVSSDNVHGIAGLLSNGTCIMGSGSLSRGVNKSGYITRGYNPPPSCSKSSVSSFTQDSHEHQQGKSCSQSEGVEDSLDEEDHLTREVPWCSIAESQPCPLQGHTMNAQNICNDFVPDQPLCYGYDARKTPSLELVAGSGRAFEGVGLQSSWSSSVLPSPSSSSSHSGKHKRRRKRPHSGREHSTKDQATNTDLSSNEGTIEFTMFNKSPSSSVSDSSSTDKTAISHCQQCADVLTAPCLHTVMVPSMVTASASL